MDKEEEDMGEDSKTMMKMENKSFYKFQLDFGSFWEGFWIYACVKVREFISQVLFMLSDGQNTDGARVL